MSKHRGLRGGRRGDAGLVLLILGSVGCVAPGEATPSEPPRVVTEPAPPLLSGRSGREGSELPQVAALGSAEAAALEAARAAGDVQAPAVEEKAAEPSPERLKAEAQRVLDDWHRAAAEGDERRYLGYFAQDGVFMGPAPDERWDFATFSSFVRDKFTTGNSWAIESTDRHLLFGPRTDFAWFDETLKTGLYSITRGTGVLRREEDTWKIVLYSMTYTVPNSISGEVTDSIKAVSRLR